MPKLTKKAAAEQASDKNVETLLVRIREARQTLDNTLSNLFEASEALREQVRRHRTASSRSHQLFATANLRFSAAFSQGLKRMSSTSERILVRASVEQEETARIDKQRQEKNKLRKAEVEKQASQEEQARQGKNADRKTAKLIEHSDTAFEEIYGEMLNGE